jgi:LSD1 subclass zinc finger protein
MAIRSCPRCKQPLSFPSGATGQFRCPHCQSVVSIHRSPRPAIPIQAEQKEIPKPALVEESGCVSPAAMDREIPYPTCEHGSMPSTDSDGSVLPDGEYPSVRRINPATVVGLIAGGFVLLMASCFVIAYQQGMKITATKAYVVNRVHITAEDLVAQYEANWDQAESNYRGKVLEVEITGKLNHSLAGRPVFVSANLNRLVLVDRPFVPQTVRIEDVRRMVQNAGMKAFDDEYLPTVYMHVKTAAVPAFSKLQGVQRITVRGTCRGGTKDTRTRPQETITFDDCELVPTP